MKLRVNGMIALMIFLALFCDLSNAEKQHDRNWQTGKVLDAQRSRYFAGTVSSGNDSDRIQDDGSYAGNSNGSRDAFYRVYETFLIEGDTYAYLA